MLTHIKYTGDTLTAERGSKRVHVHTYFGVTDDPHMTTLAVRADVLCPKENAFDEHDPEARIVSVSAKRRSQHSRCTWDITVTSTTEVDESPNPLDNPAKWSGRTVLYEIPSVFDIHGQPIVNAAGDFFEGAKLTRVGWTFTASRSIPADVSLDFIDDFVSATNDSTVTIRGKRCREKTVWLREADIGEPQKTNNVWHSPSRFTFEYSPIGWYFEPLNMGFRQLIETKEKDSTGQLRTIRKLVEITDDRGRPVSEKQMLDRDGAVPLVDGPNRDKVRKTPLEASDIIVLKFEVKQPVSFARLGRIF